MKNIPKIILGLGIALGLYGFWDYFTRSHTGMGYTSYVPWGIWVVFYTSLVGISAGISPVIFLAFGMEIKPLQQVARLVPVVSLASLACGLLFIIFDLGHWERAFSLMFSLNPASPMSYLGWLYFIYSLLLLFTLKALRDNRENILKKLALVVLVVSFFIALGEGSLFSVLRARPYWNSGLALVRYLAGACMAGVTLALFIASFHRDMEEAQKFLSRASLILVGAYFFLEMVEMGIAFAAGNIHELEAYQAVLFGPGAWLFWLLQLGLGTFLAAGLLWYAHGKGQARVLSTAAGVILLGYLASKYNMVIPGQETTLIPGLSEAFSHPKLVLSYTPTLTEILVTVGLLSLAVMAAIYLKTFIEPAKTTGEIQGRVEM